MTELAIRPEQLVAPDTSEVSSQTTQLPELFPQAAHFSHPGDAMSDAISDASNEPLDMSYADRRALPPHMIEDRTGAATYLPAELTFRNERSHRVAANILQAFGDQGGILRQMQLRLTEQDKPVIDPMALPSGILPSAVVDAGYNWHRYDLESARQIRRSIAEAALFHEIPELRPNAFDSKLAEEAYLLNQAAPGLGQVALDAHKKPGWVGDLPPHPVMPRNAQDPTQTMAV